MGKSHKRRRLEIANLIVRFGKSELLDFAAEIVVPALTDDTLERAVSDGSILICDSGMTEVRVDSSVFNVVYGRIVKDTELRREQVLDRNRRKVIKKSGRLSSAPSAVFALILENHKLVYVHETAHSPTLKAFENTIKDFIVRKHKKYSKSLNGRGAPAFPSVELIPLASERSLAEFLDLFSVLKKVDIQLLTPNNEIDNDEFFAKARAHRARVGADKTRIIHTSTAGLDKEATAKELGQAAAEANTKITVSGTDAAGDRLTGDNANFQATAQIVVEENSPPAEVAGIAVQKAAEMAEMKVIKPASWLAEPGSKVRGVLAKLRNS